MITREKPAAAVDSQILAERQAQRPGRLAWPIGTVLTPERTVAQTNAAA